MLFCRWFWCWVSCRHLHLPGGGALNAEVDQVASSVNPGAADLDNAASGALSNADSAAESDSTPAAGTSIGPYGSEGGDGSFDASSDGADALALTDNESDRVAPYAMAYYAVLYDSDGDGAGEKLVFQNSSLGLSKFGTKVNSWSFSEDASYSYSSKAPWYAAYSSIKSIQFNCPLSPVSLRYWFYGLSKLESIDFTNLDTSAVTDMSYLFYGCSSLKELDLSSFDTSAVTDMTAMFYHCSSLASLDLSSFDTGSVTAMGHYYHGGSFTELKGMFTGCSSLKELDLSSFDTSKVKDMGAMFCNCSSLSTIYASDGFDVSAVESSDAMFNACSRLVGGSGTAYSGDYTDDKQRARIDAPGSRGYFTDRNAMGAAVLYSDDALVFQADASPMQGHGDVVSSYAFNLSGVGNGTTPWAGASSKATSASFAFPLAPQSMRYWFSGFSKLESIDFTNLNTSAVMDMGYLFNVCSSIKSLDLSSFDTSAVTDMSYLFYGCSSLKELDLSSFDTSAVTDMTAMFYHCSSLASLDLSSFDTGSVTAMGHYYHGGSFTELKGMFTGCSSLKELDLSSFDTSKVKDMGAMFCNCSSLSTIYASDGFDVSAVESSDAMFNACSRLVGGSGTAYSGDYTDDKQRARIDAPGSRGYFTASCRPSDHNIIIIADEDVCEKGGTSEVIHKCTVCGREFFHDFVELAPGHVYVTDPAVEATCVADGLTQGMHCATCGKVFVAQKKIPMTGHTAVVDKAVAPTCTETGLTEGSHCSVCGQVLVAQEAVASLGGHDPVADDAVDATCTEPGLTGGFHCSRCGEVLVAQEAVPAKGHVVVQDAATEATCTEPGFSAGSHCSVCGQEITPRTEVPALGHDCGAPAVTFSDDGNTATIVWTCGRDASHKKELTVQSTSRVAATATCDAAGTTEYSVDVAAADGWPAATGTKTIADIPAKGHVFGAPEISFAPDGKSATATWRCLRDASHVVSEPCSVSSETTRAATCTANGVTSYTAVAAADEGRGLTKGVATKNIADIPAMGHAYGVPAIEFAANGRSATATWTCANDPSHVEVADCAVASRVTKPATAATPGETTYTATAPADKERGLVGGTATKTLADIPATGSTYGAPKIVFAADGKTATATWTSREDASVKVIAECTVSARVTKPATCTDKGETTYTAFADGGSENLPAGSATKVVADIDALGHEFTGYVSNGDATCEHDGTETAACAHGCGATDTRVAAGSKKPHAWGAPVILFAEDGASATAIWTCSNNVSHVKVADCAVASEVVSEASCCTAKLVRYTATATAEGMPQGTASKTVQAAPAQGHSFCEPVIAFADDMGSATATWTCAKDPSHVVTASCKVEKQVGTQATCFDNGDMLCVASFVADNGNLTVLACEHEAIPAAGHHFQGRVCSDCGTHLGDVNGNGVVNVVDAQIAYDITIGKGDYSNLPGYRAYRAAADVTGTAGSPDGELDASDAFRIQYVALCGWDID